MNARATAVLASAIALVLAGCAGDEERRTKPTPSLEQKVEQAGNRWARLFAADDPAACRYMTQPGCEQIKSPSVQFRRSFRDATVEDIAIKGERAGARFSNGEGVELSWVNGYAVGGVWWIEKVGGNAGRRFFEAAQLEDMDHEAGVRFNLDGRVLTVRLLASAPGKTRGRTGGARIRATCGESFSDPPGPGPGPDPRQTRTRLWPEGRAGMRYRFRGDISRTARWCRLEDPVVGHVAFVKFG
jgi:hypothetical protein